MNSEIIEFQNDQFGMIRASKMEDTAWFVAADICKALEIGNPSQALTRLDEDERMTLISNEGHSGQRGGAQMFNVISEAGLYTLILSSRKPEAKAFRRWITHEVIPSIRKHGAYIVPELLDALNKNEAERQRLLDDLTAEREAMEQLAGKNEVLQTALTEARPKVSYFDMILQNPHTMPVTLIAKDYGFSAVSFNRLLKDNHIQYKVGKTWALYQDYADEGYTHYNVYRRGKKAVSHMVWTQKGRLFLYNFLKHKGIIPRIETDQAKS